MVQQYRPFFVANPVRCGKGRNNLNFSEWVRWETDEIGEVVTEGEMTPPQYNLMHPEARLDDAQRQSLIQAFGN